MSAMKPRLPRSLLLALCLIYGGWLYADPITGRVIDEATKTGIPGVAIRVFISGNSWEVPQGSGADGSFSFELADGFRPAALATDFLNLEFSKPGYRKATRLRRAQQRGNFNIKDLQIRLEAIENSAGMPATAAAQPTENSPKRIFHSAYALFGANASDPDNTLAELNERLPRHLRRGIITHLQRLQLPANIALDPVPAEVEQSDSIKLRAFADSKDALAVILGEAELTRSDGEEAIDLVSEYRIIPLLPEFQPGTLYVDDHISKADFRPGSLSGSLSKTWGGSTVFALALYETRQALAQNDQEKRSAGLTRAESYLKAQKASLTGDDILNQQIDSLLALIVRERGS